MPFLLAFAVTAFAKTEQSDWGAYQKSGHRSERWNALVQAGFEAFEGGNVQVSRRFLERAAFLGCTDPLVIYKTAALEELQGNYKKALELLKKAEEGLQKNYPSHLATLGLAEQIGALHFRAAEYDEALKYYLAALETRGEDFTRNFLVGQIYRIQGKKGEALSYFEKSLRFDPPAGSPRGMRLMAKVELLQLYQEGGEQELALKMAEEILAEDPNNPAALAIRSNLEYRRIKEKEREEWKRVLEKY